MLQVPFLHYETSEGQKAFARSLESAHIRAPAKPRVQKPSPSPGPPPSVSDKGQAAPTLGSRLKDTIKLVGGGGVRDSVHASEAEADIERQDGPSSAGNRQNNVRGDLEVSTAPAPGATPVQREEDLSRPSAQPDAVFTHDRRSGERHTSRRHRHQAHDVRPPTRNLHDYLIKGYFRAGGHGFQPRRTLDQYAYAGIVTTDRDKDQVVHRYLERTKPSGEPKIFMTDQLWMWILGNGTLLQ